MTFVVYVHILTILRLRSFSDTWISSTRACSSFLSRTYVYFMIRGDDEDVLASIMQFARGLVEKWCNKVKLGVNPSKVSVKLCTNRYKTKPIEGLQLHGVPLKLVKEVKYLGVTLDDRLNWGKHIKGKCEKAIRTF